MLEHDDLRALIREDDVLAFRRRGLTSETPVVRGTAQNPDVFFQAREACNPFHDAVPGIVQEVMDEFAARTGRRYSLVDYTGAPDAERVIVVMGSGTGAVEETVETMVAAGEKVGMIVVRLFQPFPAAQLMAALPKTVKQIAVLDRTKEPGAVGEPLYQAIVTAFVEAQDSDDAAVRRRRPRSSAAATASPPRSSRRRWSSPIFDELLAGPAEAPLHASASTTTSPTCRLPISSTFSHPRPAGEVQALFFGLGSDGTVGANKASVKIIGEGTGPVRPGLLRLRQQEVRLGHLVAPALRAAADPVHVPRGRRGLRGLPPVRPAGERPDAGPGQARRDVPAQQPLRPGRGLGAAARPTSSSSSSTSRSTCG